MIRKKLLFWLTWLVLGPLVFVYYCLMAIGTGRWRSIYLKTSMVYQSTWEKMVLEKPVLRRTVDRYGKTRW